MRKHFVLRIILKYFCENKPELHIIVAGSLLGVMNMKGESFPVGKVDIMHLYPMTYEEYLLANDEKQLLDILQMEIKNSLIPSLQDTSSISGNIIS